MWGVCPEELPSAITDPSEHLTKLALFGYVQLAADTILNTRNQGRLAIVVGEAIRRLNLSFIQDRQSRERCVEVLLEVALNLLGMEKKRAGFLEQETAKVLDGIVEILRRWEDVERDENRTSVQIVVEKMLRAMKMVLKGQGMVAKMAEEIEKGLDRNDLANSFVSSCKSVIQDNVYYQIVDRALCKFGNDSATGLRWVRHLGAVQVSSNPVIAARAFDEIPDLWRRFEAVAASHPEWGDDPERFGDEIALFGTVTSLLPNVLDFRPLALLSNFRDGMVSLQLNPYKAASLEGSLHDALKIYSIIQEVLEAYDAHLMQGAYLNSRGRPNIVFKVSTGEATAIGLTEGLNSIGLGTNNTVTFTVSQEVKISMAAMKGLAAALKAGIPITLVYVTNMEGRLEDHLRESKAAELLRASLEKAVDKEATIESLGEKLSALDDMRKASRSLEERVSVLCSKKYLKSLNDKWFMEAIEEKNAFEAAQMEKDIRMAGILVTRRVFQLVFSSRVKPKWIRYVKEQYGLSEEKATQVVEALDILPASKRRAEDTYLVLGDKQVTNLTNTEFPDHQLKVWRKSLENDFKLSDFENSISAEPDSAILTRLLELQDFRKAYELTSELVHELDRIGIQVPSENGGMAPEEWSSYGPSRKTTNEFRGAYLAFKNRVLETVKRNAEDPKRVEMASATTK